MATIKEQQAMVKELKESFETRPRPKTLLKVQQATSVRPPVRGNVWISQDVFPVPHSTNVHDIFFDVIEQLSTPEMIVSSRNDVSLADVPFEWLGQRKGVAPSHIQEQLPDDECFRRLNAEVEAEITILYAHGGAFYMGSPSYSRSATTRLAKLTKGRVASITYRLSPQNTFPAAVLDLFVAYLNLLYPREGARHSAAKPGSIIFAGDSSGGNITFALLQTLLRIRDQHQFVQWDGKTVELPLPAGIAVLSPFIDTSMGPGSWFNNAETDILSEITPILRSDFQRDAAWPTNPPRDDPYSDVSTWLHPLVNVNLAQDWTGSPPIWIAIGEERGADGAKTIAARAARQGVSVSLFDYCGMPHIFPLMLAKLPQAQRCYIDWAKACQDICNGERPASCGIKILLPGDREETFEVKDAIAILSQAEHHAVIRASMARRKRLTENAFKTVGKL